MRDDLQFGLGPGAELKVSTTICNEIRASGERVVIDNVATDKRFCGHPTPAMYGFQSYISVPIRRSGGNSLARCVRLTRYRPEVIGMFELFAEIIALQLDLQANHDTATLVEAQEQFAALERDVSALEGLTSGNSRARPLKTCASGRRDYPRS